MKKHLLFFAVHAVAIVLLFSSFFYKNIFTKIENEEKHFEPGWYEQYFQMKKNEQGIIPKGALLNAYHEAMSKKTLNRNSSSNLNNIQFLGPSNVGGRTRALVVDRSNSNHLIAGGISGGVWNSFDAGASWQPVNDFAPTLSVSCMTQDFFDPKIIYYGTGEGSGNSADVNGAGIFKSTDGGNTFQQLASTNNSTFTTNWSIKADPSRANAVYAGTGSFGVQRSLDGGNTFKRVSFNSQVQDVEVLPDGKVFYTRNGNGIYKSYTGDSGTFFKLSGGGLPANGFQRIELAYCFNNPAVIYAAFEGTGSYYVPIMGVYKSSDTGTTWVDITNNFDKNNDSDFPWYCLTMAVNPTNPNVVIVGSIIVRYTISGGNTWYNVTATHSDNHTIVFDPNNPLVFYEGNDGGIHRFNSFIPTSLNNGYNVTQFYAGAFFPSGNDFFGGTQDNGTQAKRGTSDVTTWIHGGDGAFTQINQQNPFIAYASWQNGHIAQTFDAGNTNPFFYDVLGDMDADSDGDVDDATWFINPFEINRLEGSQLFFITQERVWVSYDDAGGWAPLTDFIGTPYEVGISNEADPTVYICGQSGLFFRVDNIYQNAGDEVNLKSSVPSTVKSGFIGSLAVHPNKNHVVYATFSNFSTQPRVWKIINAKSATPQWTSISGDLPSNLPVNWIEVDPQNPDSVFFIGTDIGLFSTNNGGLNWIYEDAVIPHVPIMNIRLRYSDRKLFVFTHGRGAFSAYLPGAGTGVDEKKLAVLKCSVFPNPADKNLTVAFSENFFLKEINVFDLTGKIKLSQNINVTTQRKQLNISFLQKGIYFLEIKSNDEKFWRKFIKL